jgi:ABC-type siderophore export system fused ATPase/permease subunit
MKSQALVLLFAFISLSSAVGRIPEQSGKQSAVDLIRAINTAEHAYSRHQHYFANWSELSKSEELKAAIQHFHLADSGLVTAKLSDSYSSILPGWTLRLTVSEDRKSYAVFITDNTTEKCPLSFQSDEGGIIRQATELGCTS